MSIYVVSLSEWFPLGDENHNTAYCIVDMSRCPACDERCSWKRSVGHHSVPWGNGEVWCSIKCYHSGKVAKLDKRRLRREKRRQSKLYIDYPALTWGVGMHELGDA